MQEAFFFDRPPGQRLFAVYTPPQGERRPLGLLLCNGFGKEYNLCLSPLIGLARAAAARGVAALRFDYAGYADSEGRFDEASISTMVQDIEAAAEQLRARAGVAQIALLGVRFGAALALLAAARDALVRQLVLWEPVLNPWGYLYAELRQTVTMQTVLFREVRVTRDQILDNVLAGRPTSVNGYDFNIIDEGFPLGAQLVREAQQTELDAVLPKLQARVLLLNVRKKEGPLPRPMAELAAKLERRGTPCAAHSVIEPCTFWKYDRIYATRLPQLYARTLSWLEEA